MWENSELLAFRNSAFGNQKASVFHDGWLAGNYTCTIKNTQWTGYHVKPISHRRYVFFCGTNEALVRFESPRVMARKAAKQQWMRRQMFAKWEHIWTAPEKIKLAKDQQPRPTIIIIINVRVRARTGPVGWLVGWVNDVTRKTWNGAKISQRAQIAI